MAIIAIDAPFFMIAVDSYKVYAFFNAKILFFVEMLTLTSRQVMHEHIRLSAKTGFDGFASSGAATHFKACINCGDGSLSVALVCLSASDVPLRKSKLYHQQL